MELGDFNDNSSSHWAPEWKSKTSLLQRPDVFKFQGCGFESLSFQVVEMSRSNWNSSRIFIDRGQRSILHVLHVILKRTSLQKWKSWPASPTSGTTRPQIWVQPPRSSFKTRCLGQRGAISELWPALKHIHSSGKYGPLTWGRRAIQLGAKLGQSKCQARLEAKESSQREVWGFPQATKSTTQIPTGRNSAASSYPSSVTRSPVSS